MARSYPIWVHINSCAYANDNSKHGNKSYGVKMHSEQKIKVGTSASNSHDFAKIELKVKEIDGDPDNRIFKLYVDGVKVKEAIVKNGEYEETVDKIAQIRVANEFISKL